MFGGVHGINGFAPTTGTINNRIKFPQLIKPQNPFGEDNLKFTNQPNHDVFQFTNEDGSKETISYQNGQYYIGTSAKPGMIGASLKQVSEDEAKLAVFENLMADGEFSIKQEDGSSKTIKRTENGEYVVITKAKEGNIGAGMTKVSEDEAQEIIDAELQKQNVFTEEKIDIIKY